MERIWKEIESILGEQIPQMECRKAYTLGVVDRKASEGEISPQDALAVEILLDRVEDDFSRKHPQFKGMDLREMCIGE